MLTINIGASISIPSFFYLSCSFSFYFRFFVTAICWLFDSLFGVSLIKSIFASTSLIQISFPFNSCLEKLKDLLRREFAEEALRRGSLSFAKTVST